MGRKILFPDYIKQLKKRYKNIYMCNKKKVSRTIHTNAIFYILSTGWEYVEL